MSMSDFGDPVAVSPADLPPATARGGRESNEPAMRTWLGKVQAAAPGTYELASKDADKAHPTSRGTQLRALVNKPKDAPEDWTAPYPDVAIETRAVVTGKRYRIFATRTGEPAKAGRK